MLTKDPGRKWVFEVVARGAVIIKAGYRDGRIFEGVSKFLASFYWVIKYFGKITKHLMGCEILGLISDSNKKRLFFATKVTSVTATFKQRRHHLK